MPRQAITTLILNPTNYVGTRLKARCEAGHVIVHWDHELSDEGNHWAAATALVVKLGWHKSHDPRHWVMGYLHKGIRESAVFVYDDRQHN